LIENKGRQENLALLIVAQLFLFIVMNC